MSPIKGRRLSDYCAYPASDYAPSCDTCEYRAEAEQNKREGKKMLPAPEPPANPNDYIRDQTFQRMKALITDINLSKEGRQALITYCERKKDDRAFIAALYTFDTYMWLGMILKFYFPMRRVLSEKVLERKMDEEMESRRTRWKER